MEVKGVAGVDPVTPFVYAAPVNIPIRFGSVNLQSVPARTIAPITTAAAPEIVECPDVYVGKFGVGTTVVKAGVLPCSRMDGLAVQCAYFVHQQETKASYIAQFRYACASAAASAPIFLPAIR